MQRPKPKAAYLFISCIKHGISFSPEFPCALNDSSPVASTDAIVILNNTNKIARPWLLKSIFPVVNFHRFACVIYQIARNLLFYSNLAVHLRCALAYKRYNPFLQLGWFAGRERLVNLVKLIENTAENPVQDFLCWTTQIAKYKPYI